MIKKIQQKRIKNKGVTPTASQLSEGELAINLVDKKLFTNDGSKIVELGNGTPLVRSFGNGVYNYANGYIFIGTDGRCYASVRNSVGCQAVGSWWDGAVEGLVQIPLPYQYEVTDCGCLGNHSSYALQSNGDLFTWGYGLYGQCGTGSTSNVHVPTKILSNVLRVEAGRAISYDGNGAVTYAQLTNKTWVTWGYDYRDVITGVKNTALDNTKPNPVVNPSGTTIVRIWNTGSISTVVYCLCSNGRIYGVGDNIYGLLGTGEAGAVVEKWTLIKNLPTIPSHIVSDPYSAAADAYIKTAFGWGYRDGDAHARPLAIFCINGDLWIWGQSTWGATGEGVNVPTPKKIMTGVKKVVTNGVGGPASVHALKTNGELWSWGYNNYGQLGLAGAAVSNVRPTRSATNVVDVWGGRGGHHDGYCNAHFYKSTDGKIYGCGANNYGSLALVGGWKTINTAVWTQTIWDYCGDIVEMFPMNSSGTHIDTAYGLTSTGKLYCAGSAAGGGGKGFFQGTDSNTNRQEVPLRLV